MSAVKSVLLVLHLLGILGLLAACAMAMFKNLRPARGAVWHSSLLMLLTGLGLVAIDEMNKDEALAGSGHAKIGIKLAVLLVIAASAFRLNRERKTAADAGPRNSYFLIALLTITNILIAVSLG